MILPAKNYLSDLPPFYKMMLNKVRPGWREHDASDVIETVKEIQEWIELIPLFIKVTFLVWFVFTMISYG